jgi:hypothetical protein
VLCEIDFPSSPSVYLRFCSGRITAYSESAGRFTSTHNALPIKVALSYPISWINPHERVCGCRKLELERRTHSHIADLAQNPQEMIKG